ncbi:hypothetical protein LLEC1_02663 [Akanthomyces lecanii]|uniref:mitogen-activated protein kinase kinase n=1 Tax=Cordyceps confragosa TaxID=2714763 RepID=A0A179ICS2_CORDF|nr:hypothetical protein LLEC1_02663 [Akanthomyces lecanii]
MADTDGMRRPSAEDQEDQVSDLPSQQQTLTNEESTESSLPKRMPSLRSVSDPPGRTPNSTARDLLDDARNPARLGGPAGGPLAGRMGALDANVLAKARRLQQDRMKMGGSNPSTPASPGTMSPIGGGPNGFMRRAGAPKLSDMGGGTPSSASTSNSTPGSKLDDFKKYIDAEKGWITFDGAATITKSGVNFADGQTFKISLDEVETVGELGKGNYGTVYKVRHTKPKGPRFGQGLSGFKVHQVRNNEDEARPDDGTTGKLMAMKEIRLELDDAKFTTILKELVILHECVSPYIIDFYGAFYQEGAVYMCIEYMDGGSIDKIYRGGIPENILRKITHATVSGLKCLKDDHNIIHRDVKPTNILANTRGQVKICDFGVSGNLVASIAKTNIGCQSYMAPERISGGGMAQSGNADGTYSVQSDVWSLGLSIIECALGRYPYPPEVSSTIFGQLNAIVEGEPPTLPAEGYSETAHDFVKGCTNKIPLKRPTYAAMLKHPWLSSLSKPVTIAEEAEEGEEAEQVAAKVGQMALNSATDDDEVAEWVKGALLRKATGGASSSSEEKTPTSAARPALHAAPLDSVSPLASPVLAE